MAVSVGFIGVGNMGNPMAANVLKQFPMTVFDANAKAMQNLIQAGYQQAALAAGLGERDTSIIMTVKVFGR